MLKQKKRVLNALFFSFVAGVGLEPHDLQVMSLTSYQLLYPAMFDGAKIVQKIKSPKFWAKFADKLFFRTFDV